MKTVIKSICKTVLATIAFFGVLIAFGASMEVQAAVDPLEVHYIDVGQGDCTLIKCGSHAMLVDAGDNNQGTKIQLYLMKQGIKSLDYFIVTHPDADHCGGADVIMYKFDCKTIIMPDCTNDTNTYRDVVDTMRYRGYKTTYPTVGATYTLGSATFTILGPSLIGPELNNDSVAFILRNGNNSFLFLGDAEVEEEQSILCTGIPIKSDVMHIAHHGSHSSTSDLFFNTVSPSVCVISCGADNKYCHPHAETLNKIRAKGCTLYRTDEQGSIIAISDGNSIAWNCSPTETWQSGVNTQSNVVPVVPQISNDTNQITKSSPQPEVIENVTPASGEYVANMNTKKFHYSWCDSVTKMKEKNKLFYNGPRDDLINQGYVPCKRCNP